MLVALREVGGLVDQAVARDVWCRSDGELVTALEAVHVLEQRLAAVKLSLVREVGGRGLATGQGTTSTAAWVRERLRMSAGSARRTVELAAALSAGPPVTAEALAAGAVTVEQARVITQAVSDLPSGVGVEVVEKATQTLVDFGGRFEPSILRRLGQRILHHVAPDAAEEAELAALRRQERRARSRRHLTLSTASDGEVRLTGLLDAETAGLLHAAIDPLGAPSGAGDDRTPGQRRHDALAEICRLALRTGELPESGGDRPQLVITTAFDILTRQLGTGTLDTGPMLTPETVRRLACDAAVLPAVLGGNGQVLDLGRQRRLFTGALRRALVLRDGGCAFPDCDRPPPLVRRAPPHLVAGQRVHRAGQRRAALRASPPGHPQRAVAGPPRPRRAPRIPSTHLARPHPTTPTKPLPPPNMNPGPSITATAAIRKVVSSPARSVSCLRGVLPESSANSSALVRPALVRRGEKTP